MTPPRSLTSLRNTARLGVALVTQRRLPYSINFIVTNRCNFQCVYCDAPEHAGAELTTADFRRALDELAAAGMARASFSGGEALLRDDTPELIEHAKGLGLFVSLNSNAFTLEPVIERLARSLDLVMLSLDGPEDVHDKVRRQPGSYARVVAMLARARELGVATTAITVIGPWNVERIPEVLALAGELGFWAYFQPAYRSCFDVDAGFAATEPADTFRRMADAIEEGRARGRPVGVSPSFVRRLRAGPRFGECADCTAGRYFATVMPDGTLVPCHLTSGQATYPNGRELGFARAFAAMPAVGPGPGCAISPYQESDLIFQLDPSAIVAALRHMRPAPITPRS